MLLAIFKPRQRDLEETKMTVSDSGITRRAFIAAGGAALPRRQLPLFRCRRNRSQRLRMAIVGTGNRGSLTWGRRS